MLQALQRVRDKDDRGFTLIELMVVVLIIAILIAIAIPTFLGARSRAQDRAAQADLRSAVLTAKTFFTDNETFLDTDLATTATTYESLEPSLTWGTAVTAGAPYTDIGVYVADGDDVVLVRQSAAGTYFCIHEDVGGADAGTFYDSDATLANVDSAAECAGASW